MRPDDVRRICVVALLCACQGSATPAPPAPAAVPPDAAILAIVPDAAAPPVVPARPRQPLPVAAHGQPIVAVTVADDGSAAVTIDTGANVRLWPALDGTREPVAVPLVAPQETALARTADGGFAIAALDAAGGLSLARIDRDGQLVGKVALPFEQPYAQVVAVAGGFVALRSDHRIERLQPDGTRTGTVIAGSGERIASIAARRGRALALVSSATAVTARWLDTSGDLAWGAVTPALAIDPETAVLSPDHVRLAALQPKTRRAVIVELATGAITFVRGDRRDLVPLAWIANDRVAFAHDEFELSRVEWFDAAGKRVAALGNDFELEFLTVLALDGGDDQIVGFSGHQLVLVEPRRLRYLGYQLHAASRLRPTPSGVAAALGGSTELLDGALQIERRIPTAHDVVAIDDTFAVAIVGRVERPGPFDDALVDPPNRGRRELALFEGATKRQVLPVKLAAPRLRYEPATRMLAVGSGATVTFARFDPAAQRFGEPVAVQLPAAVRELALLDPALADGSVALVVYRAGGKLIARTLDEQVLGEPRALAGELVALDRAGRTYTRIDRTVAIHAGGRELGRLADTARLAIRPSPDGTRVAAFGRGRLIVMALDGTVQWSTGVPGIKDVQWTGGELAVLASGIAKLDAATGKTVVARCGWKFGLRNHASLADTTGTTLCDR